MDNQLNTEKTPVDVTTREYPPATPVALNPPELPQTKSLAQPQGASSVLTSEAPTSTSVNHTSKVYKSSTPSRLSDEKTAFENSSAASVSPGKVISSQSLNAESSNSQPPPISGSNVLPVVPNTISSGEFEEEKHPKKRLIAIVLLIILLLLLGWLFLRNFDLSDRLGQTEQEVASIGVRLDGLEDITALQGEQGEQGPKGPSGPQGLSGDLSGGAGVDGVDGTDGQDGAPGAPGARGPKGSKGDSGTASCDFGDCVSLQASSPGTQETGNINVSGTIIAGSFSGDGSGLANLDWSNLTNFPGACPAGQAVTAIGGVLTCASFLSGSGQAWLQGGNSYGAIGVLGTTDNFDLSFITNNAEVARLTTAGQLQLAIQGSSGGILIGGDASLYRSGLNTLATDGGLVVNNADEAGLVGLRVLGTNATIEIGNGTDLSYIDTPGFWSDQSQTGDSVLRAADGNLILSARNDSGDILFTTGASDTTKATLTNAGNFTLTGDIQIQGGDLTSNQTTFNLLQSTVTTLNIGGAVGAGGINLAGGSGSTGCTVDGSNGNFTCSGSITSTATSGTQGWWSRSGTTLQPANSGDNITTSGNISTTGSGGITSAGNFVANGTALFQNSSNSTSAFQIQNQGGTTLFNADTTNSRISIGNIGTPTGQLYVAGQVPTAATGSVATGTGTRNVYVQGRYAYVASTSTFQIYDVSNPTSPTSVGSVATGSASFVYVQGRYAYLGVGNNLQIYDISNPTSPTSVSSVNTGGLVISVYVQGRYAYIANNGLTSLQIYDISNPTSPTSVGSVATSSSPQFVYTQGRYAYIAHSTATNTLRIFDVSNPTSPTSVGTASTTNTSSVYVEGRYAYLTSNSGNNLQIYDISNPTSPTSVGSVATGTNPRHVYVQGRYAYVVSGTAQTLQAYDISNPTSPTSVGSVSTGTFANSVFAQGRYVYVTNNSTNSLQVFDMGGAYVQQLEVGGVQTSTINTVGNASFGGDVSVQGGLNVSDSAVIASNLGVGGDISIQGGDILSDQTTFNLLNTTVTTLNIGGAVGAGGINLAGGSGSTGCTIDGSNGNLTCSGSISSTAASGTQGWWSRTGTTLQPANSGDNISTSGNLQLTSNAGTSTSGITFGTTDAVQLYRSQANLLATANGDSFRVQSSGGSQFLTLQSDTTSNYVDVRNGAASDWAFVSRITSDAQQRYILKTDGEMQWGSGSAAADVLFYRGGAGSMRLQSTTNSSTAFQIQDSGFNQIFNVDAANSHVTIRREDIATRDVGLTLQSANGIDWSMYSPVNTTEFRLWNDAGGGRDVITVDQDGEVGIDAFSTDVLVLNNTSVGAIEAYLQFEVEGTEYYEVGAGSDGTFFLWNDVTNQNDFLLNANNGAQIRLANTATEGLTVERYDGTEFVDIETNNYGTGEDFATLAIGEGFDASEAIFTSNGVDAWSISSSDSLDGGTNGFAIYNEGPGGASTGSALTISTGGAVRINPGITNGTLFADITGTGTGNAICHSGTASATQNIQIVDCTSAPSADYAEIYPVDEDIKYGDIVVTGSSMVNTYEKDVKTGNVDWDKVKGPITRLVKSTKPYQSSAIGIVSDSSGDFSVVGHNIKEEDNPMPIALNGRIPVNISPDSEPIKPGDYITTSEDKGKAMKATQPGFAIGKALEAWNPGAGQATVMVFVDLGWYGGKTQDDKVLPATTSNTSSGYSTKGMILVAGVTVMAMQAITLLARFVRNKKLVLSKPRRV